LNISTIAASEKAVNCSGLIDWIRSWDWGNVGNVISTHLRQNHYTDWESLVVATIDGRYAGFCTVIKQDDWGIGIDISITPFISAVYVDPAFRGKRLTKALIDAACEYAVSVGFDAVYLISAEEGLYEKYGFEILSHVVTQKGETEPLYIKNL